MSMESIGLTAMDEDGNPPHEFSMMPMMTPIIFFQKMAGVFDPGVVIECIGDVKKEVDRMLSNSGVAVEKDGSRRFTVAKHGWDKVDNKDVYHCGRKIGDLKETLGDDIGLVESDERFSNEFLDIDTKAKEFLRAQDIKYGDVFVLDSAFTGRQTLRFFGLRAGFKRPPPNVPIEVAPKHSTKYVVIKQGVFSVDEPMINKPPMIRDGVCGTPLVYAGNLVEDPEAIARGLVGGFMCYTDVRLFDDKHPGELYCFCQSVDELIKDGWRVAVEPADNGQV